MHQDTNLNCLKHYLLVIYLMEFKFSFYAIIQQKLQNRSILQNYQCNKLDIMFILHLNELIVKRFTKNIPNLLHNEGGDNSCLMKSEGQVIPLLI